MDESLIVRGDFRPESGFTGCGALTTPQAALRVQEDMNVVGFDDLPEVHWSAPPLTTVRQPLADKGRLAIRTVLRPTRGERPDAPRVELGTELVARAGTSPPAAGTR